MELICTARSVTFEFLAQLSTISLYASVAKFITRIISTAPLAESNLTRMPEK